MNKRRIEEKIFQRWIPYQSEVSYQDFKNSIMTDTEVRVDTRKGIEIIKDIQNQFNEQFKKGG